MLKHVHLREPVVYGTGDAYVDNTLTIYLTWHVATVMKLSLPISASETNRNNTQTANTLEEDLHKMTTSSDHM